MSALAEMGAALGLPPGVVGLLAGAAAVLAAATAVRAVTRMARPSGEVRERWRSLATWWILLVALAVVVVLGRAAVVVAMAGVSLLLVRETLSLTGTGRWLPLGVPVVLGLYVWAWLDWRSLFLVAVPVLLGAAALGEVVWRRFLRPRLASLRGFTVAVLVAAVGPAHVVAVASASPEAVPASPLAWLVLLLLLTESNDIAQAWSGRALGRHRMAPVLSPRKTWEGLIGGLVVTVAAAAFLVPRVTGGAGAGAAPEAGGPGLPWLPSAGLGLAVALSGTAGDLTGSALKRAAGVKDSGDLLPGHGGVLDRFDSLVLSAPTFLALIRLLGVGTP